MEPVEERVRVRVPDRTIELRVHGVSGTPPEALLGAFPVLVKGDADAGFYRAHDAGSVGGTAEAFSWGGLTSRARITALWLFLAPLSMLNVAGWMTPTHSIAERAGAARRWRDAAMRVVTVIATVLVSAIAVQAAMSVVGVMTADAPVAPGRAAAAIALAALVPVCLHLLSKVGGAPDDRDAHDDPWGRVRAFRSLGAAHLGLALAAVAAVGLLTSNGGRAPDVLGWAALAVAAVAGVLGAIAVLTTHVMGPDRSRPTSTPAAGAGALAAAVAVVAAVQRDAAYPAAGGLTGVHFGLAIAAVFALVGAAIAESRMPVRASAGHSVAFATLGFFMAFAAFGALSYALMGLTSAQSARDFIESPEPATMFRLVDFCAVVLTCAVLWVAGRVAGEVAPLAQAGHQGVDAAKRLRAAIRHTTGHVRRAGLGMLLAALALVLTELAMRALPSEDWLQTAGTLVTDPRMVIGAAGWLFVAYVIFQACRARPAVLVGVVAVVVGVAVLLRLLAQGGLDALAWLPLGADAQAWPAVDEPWIAASSFTVLAVMVAVFLPAVSVLWFVISASGNRDSRRGVGVLWDLTNFWPRLHHPWAPPPYTETAIPALEQRLRHLSADHPSHALILSCHSQGAVLGFPVMRRLLGAGEVPAASLRLLTYGNLLAAHYQELFPHLFDDDRLRSLEDANPGGWIQLFRETDPLGHPIAVLGAASRPAAHDPPRGVEQVLTHAHYSYSPEFAAALEELGGARDGASF